MRKFVLFILLVGNSLAGHTQDTTKVTPYNQMMLDTLPMYHQMVLPPTIPDTTWGDKRFNDKWIKQYMTNYYTQKFVSQMFYLVGGMFIIFPNMDGNIDLTTFHYKDYVIAGSLFVGVGWVLNVTSSRHLKRISFTETGVKFRFTK